MTTQTQFLAKAKARHHHSDQIQVRYEHPNGKKYDTFISGEEAMSRLNTKAQDRLIKSFSTKNWEQAKRSLKGEMHKRKDVSGKKIKNRLGDFVQDKIGGNVIGDTLADNVRGVDSTKDPRETEKELWQNRLHDTAFKDMVLNLAWLDLEGSLPKEDDPADADDWV
jgi:hypothetical protein